MKDRLDISLLDGEDIIKRSLSFIANNVGRVIAVITFLFASLILFTDVELCDFSRKDFGALLVLMLVASYIIYFSMEDAGEKLGEESEEYKKAREEYLSNLKLIKGEDICLLRDFCKRYSEDELKYRRDNILFSLGYTRSEYEAYLNGEECQKRAVRAFKKVKRQRAITITPTSLLSKEKINSKSELKSPESTKFIFMILKLIPSTLCMAVTVSIVLSAKDSLTLISVIDGLVKLCSLPIIGFRGYAHGYNYVRKSLSAWLETKSALIGAFLKEKSAVG